MMKAVLYSLDDQVFASKKNPLSQMQYIQNKIEKWKIYYK